ncbi:hypothetical protein [Streptomyces sp. NPDC006012]|uniref:glycosyl hydrolase family 95 catalytic domain-containing protein n=1 Tax=Streptomyces sp. NPDC006012 TaxID=3364739 RepID=UPI0036AF819E
MRSTPHPKSFPAHTPAASRIATTVPSPVPEARAVPAARPGTATAPAAKAAAHPRRRQADGHWSPEHGPQDAEGTTCAPELVRAPFDNYRTATAELQRNTPFAGTVGGLREHLYLPQVGPASGRLEERMSPDDLGETAHRQPSPFVGPFPGGRTTTATHGGDDRTATLEPGHPVTRDPDRSVTREGIAR